MTAKRRQKGGLGGETLGGMLAGFDRQIMRTLPPPHELVQKGSPVRGLSGEDDDLVIVLPSDGQAPPSGDPPSADDPPDADDPPGADDPPSEPA